jgi:hypothetical protein
MDFFNCSSGNGCNPFSEANAKTDTVKVVLRPEREKENARPNQQPKSQNGPIKEHDLAAADAAAEKERKRRQLERERAEKEAAEQARRLEVELAAAEEKALTAEKRRQEEAARLAAEQAEWQRQQEMLQAMREQELREIEERQELECQEAEAQREAEERREREELEKATREAEQKSMEREKVKKFLLEHGYLGVNAKRTKMLKAKYPLHTAVKLGDPEMISLLLSCGADSALKNSASETPKQLAQKLNRNGSHDAAIGALP